MSTKPRTGLEILKAPGTTAGEIAAILHAKEATVSTWLRRGRERLKEYLEVTL